METRHKGKILICPFLSKRKHLEVWTDQVIIMAAQCVFMCSGLNQRLQWLTNDISCNICLINFYDLIRYLISYSTLASAINKLIYRNSYQNSCKYLIHTRCLVLGLWDSWIKLFEKSFSDMVGSCQFDTNLGSSKKKEPQLRKCLHQKGNLS